MTLVRRLARPMLATAFIANGVQTMNGHPPATTPESAVHAASRIVPWIPDDPRAVARIGAATQVGAGLLLALGRAPRLAALALTGSLAATGGLADSTAPGDRRRNDALRTVGLLGGLLLATVDTEGRPSLGWRARQGTKATGRAARASGHRARRTAQRSRQRAETSARRAMARAGR